MLLGGLSSCYTTLSFQPRLQVSGVIMIDVTIVNVMVLMTLVVGGVIMIVSMIASVIIQFIAITLTAITTIYCKWAMLKML